MSVVDSGSVSQAFAGIQYKVDGQNDLIKKCIEVCQEFGVSASDLVFQWEAHVLNNNIDSDPEVDHIMAIKRALLAQSKVKKEVDSGASHRRHTSKAHNKDSISKMKGGLMANYGAMGKKVAASIPEVSSPGPSSDFTTPNKRKSMDTPSSSRQRDSRPRKLPPSTPASASASDTPKAFQTPLAIKSEASPEAASYMKREQRFKVHSTFNEALAAADRTAENSSFATRVEIRDIANVEGYRYMYEKTEAKCHTLRDKLRNITDGITENAKLRENATEEAPFAFTPVNTATQERVWCCGRICCEGDAAAINPSSVMIEGANGRRVKLDLTSVPEFSVFPGQIVVVQGHNVTGSCIKVEAFHCDASLPMHKTPASQIALFNETDAFLGGMPLSVFVSSGPYTTSADLSYKPLEDLLEHVREAKPDVVILCGPFVDSRHRLIDPSAAGTPGGFCNGDPPDSGDVMEMVMRERIASGLAGTSTKCIIIPALSDLDAPSVFPQPAFENVWIVDGENAPLMLSNPCSFKINEIVFQIATQDILVHLAGNEASRITGDRMSRLGKHIVQQRSVYPLFPAAEGANLSMAHSEELMMQGTPDVLILPSNLMAFAKRVGETLLLNPGRLTKGNTAGTFAKLSVHPILRHIRAGGTRKVQATAPQEARASPAKSEAASEDGHTEAETPSGKATSGGDLCAEVVPQQLSQEFEASSKDVAAAGEGEAKEEGGAGGAAEGGAGGDGDKTQGNGDMMEVTEESSKEEVAPASAPPKESAPPAATKQHVSHPQMDGDVHAPMLHRVLERTRVDIVKI